MSQSSFNSQLNSPDARFVAEFLSDSIEGQWRSATHFVEYFAAAQLLDALGNDQELRVRLLVEATGTHPKIAAKKSAASAAEDLQLALDEGTTTDTAVFELFSTDDWVRLLGTSTIWAFLTNDLDWLKNEQGPHSSLTRLLDLLNRALAHDILSLASVVEAIPLDELIAKLTNAQLRAIVTRALAEGRDENVFSATHLVDAVPLDDLLAGVPKEQIWSDIVVKLLIPAADLTNSDTPPAQLKPAPTSAPSVDSTQQSTSTKAAAPDSSDTETSIAPHPVSEDAPPDAGPSETTATSTTSVKDAEAEAPEDAVESPATASKPSSAPTTASLSPASTATALDPEPKTDEQVDIDVDRQPQTVSDDSDDASTPKPNKESTEVSKLAPPPHNPVPPPPSAAPAVLKKLPPLDEDTNLDELEANTLEGILASSSGSAAPKLTRPRTAPPPRKRPSERSPESQSPLAALNELPSEIRKICARLKSINRLPHQAAQMAPALLLSIESMYSELLATSDAQDQLTIIQESFPNEGLRTQAMLGLLQALDAELLVTTPSIAEESADSLSIRLLTAERQRNRGSAPPKKQTGPSRIPPPNTASSMPPGPPPRTSQVNYHASDPVPPAQRSGPPPLPARSKAVS